MTPPYVIVTRTDGSLTVHWSAKKSRYPACHARPRRDSVVYATPDEAADAVTDEHARPCRACHRYARFPNSIRNGRNS